MDAGTRCVTRGGSEIDLPKLSFDLLAALIEAAPNVVSPDQLMETVWTGLVVSPETVTQRVKLLRDALGDDPQEPRYIALVRGAGYRLIAPVRRPAEDQAAPGSRATVPAVVLAAVLIAVAAVASGLIYRGDWQPQTRLPGVARDAGQTPSIAVLPFANRSDLEADAFFADGIHDHLLVQLAGIHGLRVISRTSVMGYRDRAISIPEIARELDVGVILEGAVQRAGEQVRISVQLIDGRDDRNLWAETFDRPLSAANVFAIQGEISRAVADELKVSLLPAERARLDRPATLSLAAYDAYLKGRAEMNRFTEAGLNGAVARFQAALTEDPQFTLAYIGLAEARMLQQRFLLLNRELAVQLAESSLARALAIDPALPEALAIRGDVLRLQGDF
ncbi:MAG: winged helix-turn-helix domain-containing protein, partial [Wenzhouxiangella sp.]